MTNSTNVIPACPDKQRGAVAVLLVMGLLVVVSIIGVNVLRVFSLESDQTSRDSVGFRLEQLARMGLESNFSLLRSMGSTTALLSAEEQVRSSSQTTNRNVTNCNYFPRTDDVKLVSASGGSFENTNLLSSGSSATCLTARPHHPSLTPAQLARHTTYTDNDLFSTDSQLNVIGSNTTNDVSFRSVFPWIRHPGTASALDERYGSSEGVSRHLNQCGLASQFKSVSSQSATPLLRFRYQQDLDGLGETWINMGNSTMNLYQNGLTLEAWVWMRGDQSSKRIWQRIFDIGRGQMDGNIVFAYEYNTGELQFHIKKKGSCSNPTNETTSRDCSAEGFALPAASRIQVPHNGVNDNSLSEASGRDLWYYVGVTVDSANVSNPKVRIYTQCKRTDNSDPNNSVCALGDEVAGRGSGQTGLRLRREVDMPWSTWGSTEDYAHFRRAYVGKSHWQDDDFRGKMRDLRIWDRTLTADQLNQPITATVTDNNTESSIISNTTLRESLRISPLYRFGNDRLLLFTVKETNAVFTNTWRLVSCSWNTQLSKRTSQSLRFRMVGDARPEVTEYLPY